MKKLAVLSALALSLSLALFAGETGTNDFRISVHGTDGTTDEKGEDPAVAYNATNGEFLVVWHGRTGTDFEIWARRYDAVTLAPIGSQYVISDMGNTTTQGALDPAIAWNSVDNEYLVVWEGEDTGTENEFEIYGQRLTATGSETGVNDFRISDMGTDGETTSIGRNPDVAYNATSGEYLVVWDGDDADLLVDGEFEVWGQRIVAATGAETGSNDFRISEAGTAGVTSTLAGSAAVAWNSSDNQYLVVWSADSLGTDNENEIFAQRLSSTGGKILGEIRVSDMGPDSDANYDASNPDVAYSAATNQYLAVWRGDDNVNGLVEGEVEVFGQLMSNSGVEVGANDFRISDMGPDQDSNFGTGDPRVAYGSVVREFMVVWNGDDLVNNEFEIHGQRLTTSGAEVGDNDFRLSDMGSVDGLFDAFGADVAHGPGGLALIVFHGDDDTGTLVDQEVEVYGQFYEIALRGPDFNGDGSSDILWRNYSNGLNAIWLMTGTSYSSTVNLPTLANTAYVMAGTGDFNADGSTDIVWRNQSNGLNAIWLMNGTSYSSTSNLPTLSNTSYVIGGTGDFDGDGDDDILWRNQATGANAIWLMNGTSYSSTVNLPALANASYQFAGAADFDGDGDPDIVLRNYSTGQTALWLMNGTSYSSTVNLPTVSNTQLEIQAVADYDGDGDADIVWRNMSSGANAIWLMNGTSYSSTVNLPALVNLAYEIAGPR